MFGNLFKKHEPQPMYRIHYIRNEKINQGYGLNQKHSIETLDIPLRPFTPPKGATTFDTYYIISYLSRIVGIKLNKAHTSLACAKGVESVLEKYNFKIISNAERNQDLREIYFIEGDKKLFIQSKQFKNYVDWFAPNATDLEVGLIYNQLGLQLPPEHLLMSENELELGEE